MQLSEPIRIRVHPIEPEGASFRFIVENVSTRVIRNLVLNFYDILGPGDFGLDDTHMPSSLTDEKVLRIESLSPGELTTLDLKKWGPLSEYRGDMNRTVRCQFADGRWRTGGSRWRTVGVAIERMGANNALQGDAVNPRA